MADPLELSIDTASEVASIALSGEGRLVAEATWQAGREHGRQLLPAVEALLARHDATKDGLTAVFVCTGPGAYAGVRAGVSTAKGLAYALELPLAGVGRLEIEAYAFAATGRPVVAVHKAGRGELAWAAYHGDPWREVSPPRLSKPAQLVERLREGTLVVGEIDETLAALLPDHAVIAPASASIRRAATLAELGFARLSAGARDEAALLRPIYLRPPVISLGPKPGD